jgi:transcriptional regulator with XRE-family HTH domain
MNHDPTAWTELGKAIRGDRERQGLGRKELADRVAANGGAVSTRTIASLERGVVPRRGVKPPSVEMVVAALGWGTGWADRIIGGESAESVLGHRASSLSRPTPRDAALELLPGVYEFSRAVVAAGGSAHLRDAFDRAAQELVSSMPARVATGRSDYGLTAYRPHGQGEGVPLDDASRISDTMDDDES